MIHPLKLTILVCVLAIVPTIASADEPSVREWTTNRVQNGLVTPLTEKEGTSPRFSRVLQNPRERRVRVVANALSKDSQGREFAAFMVDARYGSEWREEIVGCVYKKSGDIFVERGDEYRPAAFLLGKNVKAVSGVCQSAARS